MSEGHLSHNTFRAWREQMQYTQARSAEVLGYSLRHIKRYDTGVWEPNTMMRLAMTALLNGLKPYENTNPPFSNAA